MNTLNLPSTLDVSRLLILHSVLSCISAVSPRAPSYNLPIALFGLYAVEKTSNEGLRQFGALHGLSFLLDVLWLFTASWETGKFMSFILLVNMFAKPVTLLAVSANFKQQGLPTVGPIGFAGFGSQSGQQGTTVWSADETPGYHGSTSYQQDMGDDDEEDIGSSQPPRQNGPGQLKKESQSGGYHTLG